MRDYGHPRQAVFLFMKTAIHPSGAASSFGLSLASARVRVIPSPRTRTREPEQGEGDLGLGPGLSPGLQT